MNVEQGEALECLRQMPAMSVDAVITDPPYFLPAQHYSARSKWPRSMADLSILEHFFRDVFNEMRRVTKPEAPIVVFCDGQSYPIFFSLLYPHWDRLIDVCWDKEERTRHGVRYSSAARVDFDRLAERRDERLGTVCAARKARRNRTDASSREACRLSAATDSASNPAWRLGS